MSSPTRRQEHGIQAQTITVSLPRAHAERLEREAAEKGVSRSRHVAGLIELAWSVIDRLAHAASGDGERVA